MKALIVVDIQNDFIPGGPLAVPEGDTIIPLINQMQEKYDLVVATQDWHPANHKSFASQHPGKNIFDKIMLNNMEQVLWPDHCVQGSPGAAFHSGLETDRIQTIFRKGMDPDIDSYSGFHDNGHKKTTGLAGYLKECGVNEVHVCGLAGDYCVYYTAKDALKEGFNTCLIEKATRSISNEEFIKAKADILKSGGKII